MFFYKGGHKSSQKYSKLPKKYPKVLKSTETYLKLLISTLKYTKVLKSTQKYIKVRGDHIFFHRVDHKSRQKYSK